MKIESITTRLPRDFEVLRAAADREGFRNMSRLRDDWDAGNERFEGSGTALFGAFDGRDLLGVGGLTREPTAPTAEVLRVRRFYVAPAFRGSGVGRALAEAVVAQARGHADRLLVNSSQLAMTFWDRQGFVRIDRVGLTHELVL